jgi:hypothetical protein
VSIDTVLHEPKLKPAKPTFSERIQERERLHRRSRRWAFVRVLAFWYCAAGLMDWRYRRDARAVQSQYDIYSEKLLLASVRTPKWTPPPKEEEAPSRDREVVYVRNPCNHGVLTPQEFVQFGYDTGNTIFLHGDTGTWGVGLEEYTEAMGIRRGRRR